MQFNYLNSQFILTYLSLRHNQITQTITIARYWKSCFMERSGVWFKRWREDIFVLYSSVSRTITAVLFLVERVIYGVDNLFINSILQGGLRAMASNGMTVLQMKEVHISRLFIQWEYNDSTWIAHSRIEIWTFPSCSDKFTIFEPFDMKMWRIRYKWKSVMDHAIFLVSWISHVKTFASISEYYKSNLNRLNFT